MSATAIISTLVTVIVTLSGAIVKLWWDNRRLQEALDDAREDHLDDLRQVAIRGTKLASLLEESANGSTSSPRVLPGGE